MIWMGQGLIMHRRSNAVRFAAWGHHLSPANSPCVIRRLQEGFEVVAMDFPGHGKSDHMNKDAWYSILEYPEYVIEAAR